MDFALDAKKGHLNKVFNRRSTLQLWSKKHPSMLHLTTQDKIPKKGMVKVEETEVTTLPVIISHETCTNACCVLAIPVKMNSKKSDECIEVYAFMDQGSSAKTLARRLDVQGKHHGLKETSVKLCAHWLESEWIGREQLELSKVLTQKVIPVSMEIVPQQHDVYKWLYLSEVKLPHIDAGVEILIGNKEFKLLEPCRVINSNMQ